MPASISAQSLNEQYGIPDTLRFESGPGGLSRAVITGEAATSVVYLHGAHVAEYQPTGRRDLLFLSKQSQFRPGEPIRGGIPICFPWFGEREGGGGVSSPPHGLARIREWELAQAHMQEQRVCLELTTRIEPFALRYRVEVGPELTLTLDVHNTGQNAAEFEQALHSYFAVSQVRNIEISGLEHGRYLDKTDQFQEKNQGDEPIRFHGEVDRIYQGTAERCVLRDPVLHRVIYVEKENARSTVVWNPWREKAMRLPDLGDDEWPDMVCIEPGNVGEQAVRLEPGQKHRMTARIYAEAL